MSDSISIILPLYNNLEYTKKFFESFYLNNPDLDHELIVIDNASTDGSTEFVEQIAKADKRIVLIKNEKNVGVAPAWNQGIKVSKFDYISILNNDIEFMLPNCLKEMCKKLKESKNIYWTSPRTCYDKEKSHSLKIRHFEQLRYGPSNTSYIVGCCFMLPRECIDNVGLFDEQFEMKYYEDLDYINRIFQYGKKVSMTASGLVYHVRGATSTKTAGGELNQTRYKKKWKDTGFDILAMQPDREVKAAKHFDFTENRRK